MIVESGYNLRKKQRREGLEIFEVRNIIFGSKEDAMRRRWL
jgi:hypothetical protein